MLYGTCHHPLSSLVPHWNPCGVSHCPISTDGTQPRQSILCNVTLVLHGCETIEQNILITRSSWCHSTIRSWSTEPKRTTGRSSDFISGCQGGSGQSNAARWISQVASYPSHLCKTQAPVMGFRPVYEVLQTNMSRDRRQVYIWPRHRHHGVNLFGRPT